MNGQEWTTAEVRTLMKYAGKLTHRQIAERIGRTPQAVSGRIARMRLAPKRRLWTQEEEDYLRKNYGLQPAKVTAAHLNRGVDAVIVRAGKLGLDRSEARKKAAEARAKILAEKPKRKSKAKPEPTPATPFVANQQKWFSALF